MIRSLPLCITLIKPPPGVPFCLQQGKADLVPPSSDSGENASFDLTVNIANDQADWPPKFRGPFVQGPPGGRFIYINSGTYAGQADSCWSRRAKAPVHSKNSVSLYFSYTYRHPVLTVNLPLLTSPLG